MTLHYACETAVTVGDLTCECDIPASETIVEDVLDAASDLLAIISGTQIGRCTAAYRPCRDPHWCGASPCSCCSLWGIHLPGLNPTVTSVKIDGATVPTSEYTIIITPGGQFVLERIGDDGAAYSWPNRNNLRLPSTAEGTFEVTVESGSEITTLTTLAAAEIACDMFAAIVGADHVLPDGVVSATMHGMTIDFRRFGDPTNQATMNLAGLQWVQRFLSTVAKEEATIIMAPELDDSWSLYQRAA